MSFQNTQEEIPSPPPLVRLNMLDQLVFPREPIITNPTTPRHRTRIKLSIRHMHSKVSIQIILACERGKMPIVKAARVHADPRPPGKGVRQ